MTHALFLSLPTQSVTRFVKGAADSKVLPRIMRLFALRYKYDGEKTFSRAGVRTDARIEAAEMLLHHKIRRDIGRGKGVES